MDTRELTAAICRAENAGDWEALAELLADDVLIVHPGIGPIRGRRENLAFLRLFVGAIDGYTRTIDDLVVEGERGAFRFSITGMHVRDLPGVPATGPFEASGAMFFLAGDGRLQRAVEILDHDSMRGLSLR